MVLGYGWPIYAQGMPISAPITMISLKDFYFMYLSVCLHSVHVVPKDIKRGGQIPRNWS